MEKPKSSENKAEDVETKTKRVDIPVPAKAEIARMSQNLDNYITGVVAGLGIKGRWAFDIQAMQLIVKEK